MAVYGYIRVSTDRQASEGESLDVQARQIEAYAQMQAPAPWKIAETFREEGVSGSTPLADRPMGARMLAQLKAGDVVLVAKLDRLFRSALDALRVVEDLRERGVSLHLLDLGGDVSGNGLAKMFLTVAAAFAEAERDRIRERVTQTKRDQAARGRFLGGAVPFGFEVRDGALVELPWNKPARAMMVRLFKRGVALRPIAEQVRDKFGVKCSHATVANLVREEGW
jgi:DNA invertase Pin-like site-specific DNA recombinase